MKKSASKQREPDMREEYDFSAGVRGKHAVRHAQGANVVMLEPDVAEAFPNASAVNDALRGLAAIIRKRQNMAAVK